MARAGLSSVTVVEAAAQLADAEGLEALTLARLADALGVRSPSLYAHVAGLADLRAGIGAHGAAELTARVATAAAGRAGPDALHAVAEAYREFAHAHPGTYAAMQLPPAGGGEPAAPAGRLVELLAGMLRGYGLEGEDAVHGVRLVRCALHGFVSLEAEDGFGIPLSLDDTFERLIAMLDRGLAR